MTTRYQEKHYEDVARILKTIWECHCNSPYDPNEPECADCQTRNGMARTFADLFAADNPPYCIHCGAPAITDEVCASAGGRLYDEHPFEGGFNREQFLAACGLESEG